MEESNQQLDQLSEAGRDMHRAIGSLTEILGLIDTYNQNIELCRDIELRSILQHNRDNSKEHAVMVLEWIRRKDPALDQQLKNYLFSDNQSPENRA